MTESTPVEQPSSDENLEPFAELLERAEAAGISNELRTFEQPQGERSYVILGLPNGRRTRRIPIFPRDVGDFMSVAFESVVVLGDYVAIVDTKSGRIEAQVTGAGPNGRYNATRLQQMPGVEVIANGNDDADREAFDEEANPTRNMTAKDWRLSVDRDDISIEISPASKVFATILQGGVTLKIDGVPTSTHDEALGALERYGAAMLFEIDLVYGMPVQLSRQRQANRRRAQQRPEHAPKFPRNHYAGQALELYQYGRTAAGLPLLEYLAYYQALEYFFPFFAREQTVNSIRTQLLHPRFDALNDAMLNKLIGLAAPAAKSGMAEREQLRATVRATVGEDDLRELIESLPEYVDHFCAKNQRIKGVTALRLDGQADLRDQVADRIYAIRCRIVHSKQDGGGTNEDVLLPSSAEAASLQADIEMLRVVAQQALVARAARA